MGVWIKRQIADKSDRLVALLKETGERCDLTVQAVSQNES